MTRLTASCYWQYRKNTAHWIYYKLVCSIVENYTEIEDIPAVALSKVPVE